jgi:CRAL/TRIO domain
MSNNDIAVYIMDFSNFGMSNFDVDNVKNVVSIFRDFYPNTLNHIILYEMPFVLSGEEQQSFRSFRAELLLSIRILPATLQIIKKLLPKQAVKLLKNVSKKNIKNFIDENNMPRSLGGKDDYVYKFIPEKELELGNNNQHEQANMNLSQRKVS